MNHHDSGLNSESPGKGFLLGVCAVASLGGLLFGFDTAVISGTVSSVSERFALSGWHVGWFASSALLGCIVGAAFAGVLSDRLGRRPVLIAAASLFLISAIGSAVPPNFGWLAIARVVGGLGVGLASVVAPTYIAEFSPAAVRGRLVALYQLSIVIGILLAYLSNFGLQNWSEHLVGSSAGIAWVDWLVRDETWRGMFGAEVLPALSFLLLLCFSPESPRWLILNGQAEKGRQLLGHVQALHAAEAEYRAIIDGTLNTKSSWTEIMQPRYRRALIVGVGLSLFGQLTGVNVVVYFGPSILESAGIAKDGALAFQVGFGVINLVFTLIALALIDSWGRRSLLIGGMSVVSGMLLVVGALFAMQSEAQFRWSEYGIVAALAIYFAAVALSICAVIWVLTPEVFPNQVRGTGVSIATFTNWATNALSAFWFPVVTERFSMQTAFFLFAFICLIATYFFYKVVPETRGRSLEEIETGWLHVSKASLT